MRKGIGAFVLLWAGFCHAQERVNGGYVLDGTLRSSGAASAVDFSGAGSTAPAKTGLLASRPSSCTQGQMYFATDAAAGQNLYLCTAANTWSAAAGGGSSSFSVSSSAPSNPCPAQDALWNYTAPSPKQLWWCPAAGDAWQQLLATDGIGTGGMTFGEGAAPASPTAGQDTLFFDSSDHKVKYVNSSATLAVIAVVGRNGDYSAAQITHAVADNSNAAMTGYYDLSGGSFRFPESAIPLPAAGGNTGKVYMATNGSSVGDCSTGGGSVRVLCRSTGAAYECAGNCSTGGGGTNYQTVQSGGTPQTQRSAINFQGAVTCSDDAANNRTNCTASTGTNNPAGNTGDMQKNGGGSFAAAVAGTDYYKPGDAIEYSDLPSKVSARQFGFLFGADNGNALANGDLTQNAIFVNTLSAITITAIWCQTDSGTQAIVLKNGSTAIHSATMNCVPSVNTGNTDGSTGYLTSFSAAGMNQFDILNASGTANTTTKRISLFLRYTVN